MAEVARLVDAGFRRSDPRLRVWRAQERAFWINPSRLGMPDDGARRPQRQAAIAIPCGRLGSREYPSRGNL